MPPSPTTSRSSKVFSGGRSHRGPLYDDPIPEPAYLELTTLDEIDRVMVDATTISSDTEGWPWLPWSVQLTVRPGESLRGPEASAWISFTDLWSGSTRPLSRTDLSSDNALHDLAVFRALGIDTTRLRYDDTMIMAFNLQLEPQGLKPLCSRWCGMKMEHYEDVMGDADTRLARDWLTMVLENEEYAHAGRCHEAFTQLTTTPYTDKKGKIRPGRRLKVPPNLPKTKLHGAVIRCLRSERPAGLWADQVLDRHVEAGPCYGPMWVATLDHVDRGRAIRYAGRDSDGTHRLAPQLEDRLRANDLWPVYQADLRTVPLIDRMQQVGIRPDLDHFAALGADLGGELEGILARLRGRISSDSTLNPNSGDQVAELLFTRSGLRSLKRTAGGDDSTNDKVLEALEKDLQDRQRHSRHRQ